MNTLTSVKKQILALIEELNPTSEYLTDDPDIQAKINYVINQIQVELSRVKKLPSKKNIEVTKDLQLDLNEIDSNIYQLNVIRGVDYEIIENTITFKGDGNATIYFYKFPELITDSNEKSYIFELPTDLMQVLPYGVAGDLLKSDISANYGRVYSERYELMINRLDPRYSTDTITIEGDNYGI